ncbi:hypothetical protein RPMA_12315 [Tardiphaga alba]|uniref:Chromosomal replication initiator DnaA C-terminal domain-containing protein n=1 Tax=Tardiphaga alba TaxID=340268 RepID=A0ABX8A897_9BRAD|nr:hypothetical protein [Tardiphaga alba]QUS39531.1 hypothetical protein RPMA_12315 [Tardiphaga alba]
MTGKEIIARVLAETGVSEEQFFSKDKTAKPLAARVMAITELAAIGMSNSAIGRLLGRDRTTVGYWRVSARRDVRRAYARAYQDARQPDRKRAVLEQTPLQVRVKRKAKRPPQKLRLSELISDDRATIVRCERHTSAPQHLIEDARRRALAAKSLTAATFGDPPPGYSALDRRKMSEARA